MFLFNYKLDFLHQVLKENLQTTGGEFDRDIIDSTPCNKNVVFQKLRIILIRFFLVSIQTRFYE